MILLVISSILMMISLLVSQLFFLMPLQNQLAKNRIHEIQQFEVAEASLRYAENLLSEQLLQRETEIPLPSVVSFEYSNYEASIKIIKLPKAFCIWPQKRIGHYYQLTTCVKPARTISYGNPLRLRSTIALPDGIHCSKNLVNRPMGRSSWCQLN